MALFAVPLNAVVLIVTFVPPAPTTIFVEITGLVTFAKKPIGFPAKLRELLAVPVKAVEFTVVLIVEFPTVTAFTIESAEAFILVFPAAVEITVEVELITVLVTLFPTVRVEVLTTILVPTAKVVVMTGVVTLAKKPIGFPPKLRALLAVPEKAVVLIVTFTTPAPTTTFVVKTGLVTLA